MDHTWVPTWACATIAICFAMLVLPLWAVALATIAYVAYKVAT